jgi:CheY-like chemotaxis protein
MAHILIIDDSASIRVFLEQTLTGAGHTVHAAADGREGLVQLQHERFDLVITDLYMPEADGLETLRTARAQGRLPRAIAISSQNTIMNLLPAARLLGADASLQKPFTAEQLLRAVNEVLALPPVTPAAGTGAAGR